MTLRWIPGAAAVAGLALVVLTLGTCAGAAEEKPRTVTATFAIEGMTCGGCEAGVELKVGRLDGVQTVEASYEQRRATVTYAPNRVTPQAIIEAIEELGYSAELVEGEPAKTGSGTSSHRSA